MLSTPTPRSRPRWVATGVVVAALAAPLAAAFGGAVPAAATTPPPGTTPDPSTPTTPDVTTPTTPATTTPDLSGAAAAATATWSPPASLLEENRFTFAVTGEISGQATVHAALVKDATCPASPLFPRQVASGSRVNVVAKGPVPATTPAVLGGTYSASVSLTPKDSGVFRLCGWIVGFPSASEASTVAKFDQIVSVGNKSATLTAEMPDAARAGDYFTVKVSGTTPGTGRRVLIMAEPDKGQACEPLRKAASGKRPLQTVVGLPKGDYTKTLRLRYRTKTAGPHLLCAQIVETVDRVPEASAARVMQISEGLKCVNTQTALAQRTRDLTVIRNRRDSAKSRLAAAKKKVGPAKARLSKQQKASNKRISAARKAVSRAKSKAAKQRANRRLAQVRKAENKKIYRAGAPLRKANATVRQHQRAYSQYRTGANLLMDTISRTRKDLTKYCAKP
ncbi:MAG: hypothetical protein JHD16_03695 [Solirubrobacteraceae bacterium]|nr:hypothetical protein [Solirubrobacteraceae bacterium]